MIKITYDPQTLEKLRILLHSLETSLHWTMELGKKAGGFALCILVPEPRPAPNTRYQLEREWVFQGNALLMQNIALFMRIITLTLHFHFCQGKEEHSEDNKWQRSFFLPTILWVCFVWLSVSIKKNQKKPNKFYGFSILFNNLSELSWRPDWAVKGNPGEVSQRSSYWFCSVCHRRAHWH